MIKFIFLLFLSQKLIANDVPLDAFCSDPVTYLCDQDLTLFSKLKVKEAGFIEQLTQQIESRKQYYIDLDKLTKELDKKGLSEYLKQKGITSFVATNKKRTEYTDYIPFEQMYGSDAVVKIHNRIENNIIGTLGESEKLAMQTIAVVVPNEIPIINGKFFYNMHTGRASFLDGNSYIRYAYAPLSGIKNYILIKGLNWLLEDGESPESFDALIYHELGRVFCMHHDICSKENEYKADEFMYNVIARQIPDNDYKNKISDVQLNLLKKYMRYFCYSRKVNGDGDNFDHPITTLRIKMLTNAPEMKAKIGCK